MPAAPIWVLVKNTAVLASVTSIHTRPIGRHWLWSEQSFGHNFTPHMVPRHPSSHSHFPSWLHVPCPPVARAFFYHMHRQSTSLCKYTSMPCGELLPIPSIQPYWHLSISFIPVFEVLLYLNSLFVIFTFQQNQEKMAPSNVGYPL